MNIYEYFELCNLRDAIGSPVYGYKCLRRYRRYRRIVGDGVSAHKPLLSIVHGRGSGSVQLLTGGRRVSQASPTLSLAILEPLVTAAIRQSQ